MKQMRVEAWCDLHRSRDDEMVEATLEFVVTVAERRYLLDLCEQHYEEVETQMNELRDAGTEEVRKRKRTQGTHAAANQAVIMKRSVRGRPGFDQDDVQTRTCPECGVVMVNRQGLSTHTRKRHDRKLGDYDWTHLLNNDATAKEDALV